ncbi:MAG: DUF3108 domain-containing protein [Acidobacteria bacterium]|nr:DUF3108 domain-containing protein [Acidobacteriota bacterium]
MRVLRVLGLAVALLIGSLAAPLLRAQELPKSLPALSSGETLRFRLLWPSGIALGEAVISSTAGQNELHFEMRIEADLPVRRISGSVTASATRDGLCSLKYHRKMIEGPKTSEEKIDFDQKNHQAIRMLGGQTTTVPIAACARDPLTFLYYYRNQLAAGSTADTASFFLGSERSLEVKPAGTETVTVSGRERQAEKFLVTYHSRNSAKTFELWFSSDSRREPVLVRLPSPLAVFSAELE